MRSGWPELGLGLKLELGWAGARMGLELGLGLGRGGQVWGEGWVGRSQVAPAIAGAEAARPRPGFFAGRPRRETKS